MKIDLYQEITITRDVPEQDLLTGDVATLLDYVPHPQGGEDGAVLELFNALGESIGVRVVSASAIAPLQANQMPTVRTVTTLVDPNIWADKLDHVINKRRELLKKLAEEHH